MKEIIKLALIVGMSAALLWIFWGIWLRGSHYLQEPNRLILSRETVLMVSILLFGLREFVRALVTRATAGGVIASDRPGATRRRRPAAILSFRRKNY